MLERVQSEMQLPLFELNLAALRSLITSLTTSIKPILPNIEPIIVSRSLLFLPCSIPF